jgi:hypothetical protein
MGTLLSVFTGVDVTVQLTRCGKDKPEIWRGWTKRLGKIFRMKLDAHKIGMVVQLDHLHSILVLVIGFRVSVAVEPQALFLHSAHKLRVDLVSMSMPLFNVRSLAVQLPQLAGAAIEHSGSKP